MRRSSDHWTRSAGMSNQGDRFHALHRRANRYMSNILGKLGLASRTQAALYAVEHKLVEPTK